MVALGVGPLRATWLGPASPGTQITGHKTEAMYRRYNIVNEQDIRAALVKTKACLETKTG